MSVTNFMFLTLPTVSVTLGPEWATELNAALEVIDEHDHSSGKGTPVIVAGLNIDDDLTFNSNKATTLFSTQYIDTTTPLSGVSNALSLSTAGGDLYYTNAAGAAIQLTDGGSPVFPDPAPFSTFTFSNVNSNLVIGPSNPAVYMTVDTTAARTISLPLASTVDAGRVYVFKDKNNNANVNPITIQRQGSDLIDGLTSYTISSNNGLIWVVGDGVSNWYVS